MQKSSIAEPNFKNSECLQRQFDVVFTLMTQLNEELRLHYVQNFQLILLCLVVTKGHAYSNNMQLLAAVCLSMYDFLLPPGITGLIH